MGSVKMILLFGGGEIEGFKPRQVGSLSYEDFLLKDFDSQFFPGERKLKGFIKIVKDRPS